MGILRGLFRKRKNVDYPPADYSVLGVDIHSHFIPGIDDGAATLEDSIGMIREMHDLGYRKVITTPHIMGDYYKNGPETILPGLEKVREVIANEGINIEIEAAAEYYLDEMFEAKMKNRELLTFGGNYVLVEMAFVSESPLLKNIIFDLQMADYKPVMAHVERYPYWYNDYSIYEDLVSRGMLLQLNINSITGYYSPETAQASKYLIDNDMISFLGSDCHHMGHINLMQECRKEEYLHKALASEKLLNATL